MQAVLEELVALAKRKAAEREALLGKEPQLEKIEFREESGQTSLQTGETSPDPMAQYVESQRRRAELFNRNRGKLNEDDGYDCPACLNRGCSYKTDGEGHLISVPCKCMTIRNNRRRIEQSGLSDLLARYTFEAWRAEEEWQGELLDAARQYAANPDGWFAVCGRPGTGKTHICTAICGELMKNGCDVRYMLWRDVATTLKANSMRDAESYSREIEPLKTVKCLYIDDFYKIGGKRPPTVMDINLAFEIINARYNSSGLITIVSSERSIDELMRIDEAVASRIYERTHKNRNYINLAGKENRRMAQES